MSYDALVPSEAGLPLSLQVVVPPKELVLAGKDAAAEYDELAEPQDFQDDPEWVIFLWPFHPQPQLAATGGPLTDPSIFAWIFKNGFSCL